jgi:hypothetical protein
MDSNGNVVAVWSQYDGSDQRICWAKFNGTTWTAAAVLDNELYGDSSPHDNGGTHIAFGADDTAVCIWIDGNGNLSAAKFDGTTFETPVQLDNDETMQNARVGRLAFIPGTNNAFAAWTEEVESGENALFVRKYNTTTGWAASTERLDFVDNLGDTVYSKEIAFSETRGLVVFHKGNDWNHTYIYAATYDVATDTWTKPTAIGDRLDSALYQSYNDRFYDKNVISLAFLPNGECMMTYPDQAKGYYFIVNRNWKADGTWTDTREIQGVYADGIESIGALAVDGFGNAFYPYNADIDDPWHDSEAYLYFASRYSSVDNYWHRPSTARDSISLPLYGDSSVSSYAPIPKLVFDSKGRAFGFFGMTTGRGDLRLFYNQYK